MFFINFILSVLCVSAPLRAQFHAKAQRRKVYFQYLDSWYELRTVIYDKLKNKKNTPNKLGSVIKSV
jgi:hypothetical protein